MANDIYIASASKLSWAAENERLLEKLRMSGIEVHSFEGWKGLGRFVKRGSKSRAFQVQCGMVRIGINPVTGEVWYEKKFKTAYGFTKDQTY